jgi:hypothetical protein
VHRLTAEDAAAMALLGAMDLGDDRGLGDAIIRRCLQHVAELEAMTAIV